MAEGSTPKPKGKRTKADIDPNESKLDRFHRVAAPRVQKAIKAISLVSACGNRLTYEYTEEDVSLIQVAFSDAYTALDKAFMAHVKEDSAFSF